MFGILGIYETHIFFWYLDSFIYLYQLVSLLYIDLFVDVTDVGLRLTPGGEREAGGTSEWGPGFHEFGEILWFNLLCVRLGTVYQFIKNATNRP